MTIGENDYIVNPCCAIIGESSYMKIHVYPEDIAGEKIVWRVIEGTASFASGNSGRDVVVVAGGSDGDTIVLEVDIDGCPGRKPRFELRATQSSEVRLYPYLITGAPGAELSQEQLSERLHSVNMIYRQVGLHFSLSPLVLIDNPEWSHLGLAKMSITREIQNYAHHTDGVEVYFIGGQGDVVDYDRRALGRGNANGVVISCNAMGRVLAHEIGHVAGLADVYVDGNCVEQYQPVRKEWMPDDWANGTGSRFYSSGTAPIDLLPHLLMFGTDNSIHFDIPSGSVRGFVENQRSHQRSLGNAAVGRSTMLIYPPHTK